MGLRLVDGEDLRRALPMEIAVDALEAAFATKAPPKAPLRSRIPTSSGDLLLMPAVGEGGTGVKLVTVNAENPGRGLPLIHALYVLFDATTLEPRALVDGAALTALRTSAVSGLATRHLARPDARRLVVFGAGVQARAHLEAMQAVRPVEEALIVSRTRERADALRREASGLGLDAGIGEPDAVAGADLVCTCTTSPTPVFDGSLLPPGSHVNAVGAYTPETREIDDETVRRGRIVVETREAALEEAGDLLLPLRAGVIDEDDLIADLSEVVGGARVRRSDEDITVFKSVGVAFEDLALAVAALARLEGM